MSRWMPDPWPGPGPGRRAAACAGGLREVITTGEQLQITPAIRTLFARRPELELHNHYGPTETHVATAYRLSGEPSQWPDYPSIGVPVGNTTVYVVDRGGSPVPVG